MNPRKKDRKNESTGGKGRVSLGSLGLGVRALSIPYTTGTEVGCVHESTDTTAVGGYPDGRVGSPLEVTVVVGLDVSKGRVVDGSRTPVGPGTVVGSPFTRGPETVTVTVVNEIVVVTVTGADGVTTRVHPLVRLIGSLSLDPPGAEVFVFPTDVFPVRDPYSLISRRWSPFLLCP